MNNLIKVVLVFGLVIVIGNLAMAQEEIFRRIKSDPPEKPITQLGFVGLGRMGQGMAMRLMDSGFKVTGFDVSSLGRELFKGIGGRAAESLRELVSQMKGRKVVWLMVPAGKPVDEAIAEIKDLLKPGDIIIDGGNSYYKDSIRRAEELNKIGVYFLDVGTSGGSRAAEGNGMSLMIGGDERVYKLAEPLFNALAWRDDDNVAVGYGRVGDSGAGHFVKAVVHNSIEYGFFQSLAEGLEILAKYFAWDVDKLREVMARAQMGSAIRSWTVSLAEENFYYKERFQMIGPKIGGGTYGTWGQEAGREFGVATSVIDAAVKARMDSQKMEPYIPGAFASRVISGMRYYMGGHEYQALPEAVTQEKLAQSLGRVDGIVRDIPEEFVEKVISTVAFVWLEALKEGYALLDKSPFHFNAQDKAEINRIWEHGAVIMSSLVRLAGEYFSQGGSLEQVLQSIQRNLGIDLNTATYVQEIARRLGIPTPALDAALGMR